MTTVAISATMAPLPPSVVEHSVSPKTTPQKNLAPVSRAPAANSSAAPSSSPSMAPVANTEGGTPKKTTPDGTRSPNTTRNGPPKIVVKKEPPTSPELPTSRHRPRKLDLSKDPSGAGLLSSRPSAGQLTARGETLGMHDVGLACLSPGFSTQDPTMREQLQRSISVRDHQRSIIEARLQKTAKPGEGGDAGAKTGEGTGPSGLKTPGTSRKRPPPGLSIVPPSHEQFATERVIQSAPLHQTFTGRHQPHPATRHTTNQHSNLSNTSHIHHVPATQTNNRLPPITDVFASERLGAHREGGSRSAFYQSNSASNSSHSNNRPSFPSPGHPPAQPNATTTSSGRPREYRSAEEAVASMSGGREDLLPKIIHYGGHQPPTPPSPLVGNGLTPHKMVHLESNGNMGRSGGGRRRARAEYERDMGSPPLGSGPDARRGPFGEGRESPESQRRKKEEFLALCSRAWDLFHS